MKLQWHKCVIRIIQAVLLATVFATSSVWAQSIDDLRKQFDTTWKTQDWPAAQAIAKQITAQPQSTAADWRNLANTFLVQKNVDEAYAANLELVKRTGARSSDHSSICWYLLERNQPLQARPDCEKAVSIGKKNATALVNLGHMYLLIGDKANALPWYEKALAHIGNDIDYNHGPLKGFDLFIKNGWFASDAQASKQLMLTEWQSKYAPESEYYGTYDRFKSLLTAARDSENYSSVQQFVSAFMAKYPHADKVKKRFECSIDVAKLPTPTIRLNQDIMKKLDQQRLSSIEKICFDGLDIEISSSEYTLSSAHVALIRLICQNNDANCQRLEAIRVLQDDKNSEGFKWAFEQGRGKYLSNEERYYNQYSAKERKDDAEANERLKIVNANLAEANILLAKKEFLITITSISSKNDFRIVEVLNKIKPNGEFYSLTTNEILAPIFSKKDILPVNVELLYLIQKWFDTNNIK